MEPTPEELEAFRARARQVPFLRHLGIELERVGNGEAEMSLIVRDEHLQTMGIVHGGVLASILDSVTWWAAFAVQPRDSASRLTSIDLKVNYLSALRSGRAVARARCKKAGGRLCYATAEILDDTGKLLADGSSTLLVTK
jgi:uncharacterized protein (TIGR00369 family)